MEWYNVCLLEKRYRWFDIEAKSKEEAEQKVWDMFICDKLVTDPDQEIQEAEITTEKPIPTSYGHYVGQPGTVDTYD